MRPFLSVRDRSHISNEIERYQNFAIFSPPECNGTYKLTIGEPDPYARGYFDELIPEESRTRQTILIGGRLLKLEPMRVALDL